MVYLAWINCARPVWLSDSGNDFLKGFVSHELLAVLGFIFAITVAAAGSLHIELNRIQDASGRKFHGTRKAITQSVVSLFVVFFIALAAVVIKPIIGRHTEWFNALAIVCIYWYFSVMWSLIKTTFKIPPATEVQKPEGE